MNIEKLTREKIQNNNWLVSPSSLDSDAVMILDSDENFIELYYPQTKEERRSLIKDFYFMNANKG